MDDVDGYREAPMRCPACAELMQARVLSEATVDTCPACRGVWIDWFDGELVAIAKETAPLSMPEARVPRQERHVCPRCTQPLGAETFLDKVMLLRCSDCAGCFVTREAFTALVEMVPEPNAPNDAGLLDRLLAFVKRLLEGADSP